VLGREIDGLKLTFHLSGINNKNFLMRDEETGTYWQQINGAAVSGPLAGRVLTLIPSDELTFARQSPVLDRVNGTPLLLVLGPDGKSFRVFLSRIDGQDAEFFLQADSSADPAAEKKDWTLLDATTASQWNFQGCATSGPAQGKCLARIPALKDYWFDWRNYHPDTTVYKYLRQ